jgi:SprT-like family
MRHRVFVFSLAVFLFLTAGLVCSSSLSSRKVVHDSDGLQASFNAYNDEYFDGRLPQTSVRWVDIPKYGDQFTMGTSHEDDINKVYSIQIDTKSNITVITAHMTLFHEMCHLATAMKAREIGQDPHGPMFQRCMHELADERAFESLW